MLEDTKRVIRSLIPKKDRQYGKDWAARTQLNMWGELSCYGMVVSLMYIKMCKQKGFIIFFSKDNICFHKLYTFCKYSMYQYSVVDGERNVWL